MPVELGVPARELSLEVESVGEARALRVAQAVMRMDVKASILVEFLRCGGL